MKKYLNEISVIIIFIFAIGGNLAYSQISKGYARVKVSYNIQIHLDKNGDIYKIFEEFSPGLTNRAEKAASEIDYTLLFNDSISIFQLEKKLYSDIRAARFAIGKSNYYGRIKQQSTNYITEELQEDFGKFLVSRPYQEWQLHDESKMIDNYLCFKATTFYTITNPAGKIFKYNFTAWYAPELPYKYGPAGYGNLPGLIIELQGGSFTYGVKKIEFFKENENSKFNKMPKLKKLKQIDEEEFERLAAEDEKRWRERKQ